MAYLAFYRTFRPTSFDGVVRQEHIVKILKNQIETGKIGHAYLFCGPRGTGKTTLAKIFARAINCEHPRDGSPCGECPACKALQSGSSLDISEIDAASNNGVDEMRDLREKVQYPPVNGRYKVYIIDEVHMLSQSAFNAVLKTLEEPPAHAVFILATTEPQKIPATILSRCMRFDFKLIPQADLEGLIKSVYDKTGKEYEKEAISAIARAGNGSARDSLSIADMCSSYSQGKLMYEDVNMILGKADFFAVADLVESVLSRRSGETLTKAENILSTGKGIGVLVRDILNLLNNVAIAKMCKNAEEILNLPAARFERLKSIANESDGAAVLRSTEILTKAEGDMRYAADGRVTLEAALLKAAMPETDYDPSALLSRIEKLEKEVKEGVKVQIKSAPAAAVPVSPAPVAVTGESPAPVTQELTAKAKPAEDIFRHAEPAVSPSGESARHGRREDAAFAETPSYVKRNAEAVKGGVSALSQVSDGDNPFATAKPSDVSSAKSSLNSVASDDAPAVSDNTRQGSLFDSVKPTAPQASSSLTEADKSSAFGKLIRLYRTTMRNAVIFTLLQDMDCSFEGDTMVLETTSEQVCKSLKKEENYQILMDGLKTLGVFSLDIRKKEPGENKFEKALNELKENFKGVDIEIK